MQTSLSWIEAARPVNWGGVFFICLSAYALGCFTAGYYLVRMLTGGDLRELGSRSVGARNVHRVLGKTGFCLTVLLDFGKGSLAVWAAKRLGFGVFSVDVAMLAVVAGHIWPGQLRFRGGKGMATALGGLLLWEPLLPMVFVVLFLVFWVIRRRSVPAGLLALAILPLAEPWLRAGLQPFITACLLSTLVLAAHRRNLAEEFSRLLASHQSHLPPHQRPS